MPRETGPRATGEQVLGLDAQALVDRQQRAFVQAALDGQRRRQVLVRVGQHHRCCRRRRPAPRAIERIAPGEAEALLVPGLHRLRATSSQRRAVAISSAGAARAPGRPSAPWPARHACLPSARHRGLQADQPRQALRAAGAGQQTHLHLGQADHRGRRRVGQHRWWQASASSKPPPIAVPLIAATNGLAAGLEPRYTRDSEPYFEQHRQRIVGGVVEVGLHRHQVGAGDEGLLPEVTMAPLMAASPATRSMPRQAVDERLVDHVHRLAGIVDRQQRDAVGIDLAADQSCAFVVVASDRSITIAEPMPAATHRLTRAVPFAAALEFVERGAEDHRARAPSGRPIAIAPPLTLMRSWSMPARSMKVSTTDEKASFSSHRSMSAVRHAGARQPRRRRAVEHQRGSGADGGERPDAARGFRPGARRGRLPTSTAAAPSTMPLELPAW